MMLARVVTNVRGANFCLKFIQNTPQKKRKILLRKKRFWFSLGLYTLNKKILSLGFFLFFFLAFVIKERRETNNTYARGCGDDEG